MSSPPTIDISVVTVNKTVLTEPICLATTSASSAVFAFAPLGTPIPYWDRIRIIVYILPRMAVPI
jgi:hypothetical protein